ncbi:hypothetical protein ACFQ0B_65860 [Nonomuraea thailandensis]
MLVLLDNAADLAQVRPFVSGPLGTAVLVTSRESLAAGDDCVQLRLGPLSDAEATAMLSRLVGADRVSADLDQTARLVRLCDGFPLALRIACARLLDRPDWSVGALTARLSDERRRLAELEAGELAVRSSLAASWGALSGSAREIDAEAARLLALLGLLHVPDVTVEAATALADSPQAGVERALERLCDAHLLDAGEPGRYHPHDLVRLFAADLLPAGERMAPLKRAIGYYAESARAAARTSDPHRVHCLHPRIDAGAGPSPAPRRRAPGSGGRRPRCSPPPSRRWPTRTTTWRGPARRSGSRCGGTSRRRTGCAGSSRWASACSRRASASTTRSSGWRRTPTSRRACTSGATRSASITTGGICAWPGNWAIVSTSSGRTATWPTRC